MKKIVIMITAIAVFGVFAASAQRDNRLHEKGVVSVANNDSIDGSHVEKAFKSVAPVSPKDNGLPRFAIVGKNHQFYLGIGAQFLGEAVYDIGGNAGSEICFTPSAFTPAEPGNGAGLGFGWQSSSIYFNIIGLPNTSNQIGVFFKLNFTGTGNTVSCYHFYAKYRGLTAGYTNSLFSDGAAEPMTIDFEGPNGYPYATLFTAYWTQNFTDHLSGAIGIDEPATSLTTDSHTASVKARTPSVPLYLQYAWGGGSSHVRLSGILRPMQYRDVTAGRNRNLFGGGVQLSGMTAVVGGLSLQFNAAYGTGIGSYIQDDEGLGLDAVATHREGIMKSVRTLGITGGLNYAFSSRLSSNLVYSHVSNWLPDDAVTVAGQYRSGDYVAANLIYNINKFVSAGVEYDYGLRKGVETGSVHVNRIQAQMAVTF
ncbi:MAG: hypothetical protein K2M01_07570 [Paramuribaculum sp.]|nr:hypothetical protein [Paramuribaculum sp.]